MILIVFRILERQSSMDWPARIFEAVFLRQFLRLFFRTVFLCGFLEVPFFYEAAVPLVRVRAGGQVLDLMLSWTR